MSPPSPLWSHLEAVIQPCSAHERRVLLLDDDGTLTPIASHPDTVRLSPTMQEVLNVLAAHPRYQAAIVSGRALADVMCHPQGLE
jgi:trehalose-phosphatase